MCAMKKTSEKNFGQILTSLRRQKGFTQKQLAQAIGVSIRVISYYESESKHPPTHLLMPLAKALRVTTDELFGLKDLKLQLEPKYAALWRKLKQAEQLSPKDQRAVVRHIEALLKSNQNNFTNKK